MTYTHQHHKQVMSVLLLIAGMTGGLFFIQFGADWIGFVFAVAGGVVSLAALKHDSISGNMGVSNV